MPMTMEITMDEPGQQTTLEVGVDDQQGVASTETGETQTRRGHLIDDDEEAINEHYAG